MFLLYLLVGEIKGIIDWIKQAHVAGTNFIVQINLHEGVYWYIKDYGQLSRRLKCHVNGKCLTYTKQHNERNSNGFKCKVI